MGYVNIKIGSIPYIVHWEHSIGKSLTTTTWICKLTGKNGLTNSQYNLNSIGHNVTKLNKSVALLIKTFINSDGFAGMTLTQYLEKCLNKSHG